MRINFIRLLRMALLIFLLSLVSCKREKKTIIEGQLIEPKGAYVYLASMDLIETKVVDSVKVNNKGYFKFKKRIKNPDFFQIFLDKSDFIILLLEPGQRINLKANANDLGNSYSVTGSEGSSKVKYLTDNLKWTRKKLDSLENIIDDSFEKPGFDTLYTRLNNQYISSIKEQRNFSIKFILENYRSLASIIALYQQLNDSTYVLNQNRDLQLVNLVADTLKKYYPEVKSVNILLSDRETLNQNYNAMRLGLMKHSDEVSFPNISLLNINGEKISLDQLKSKNKCVLVNFWSPENDECIIVLRGLRELYPDYKNKGFEIFNIALVDDQLSWEEYIKSNNIPGINVIDKTASSAVLYNVGSLPASYLIGPDGNISGKDLFGENLKNKLNRIFK